MTHAERIRDAERAVVEAATGLIQSQAGLLAAAKYVVLERAVDALVVLRAECCPECKGTGYVARRDDGMNECDEYGDPVCPAHCDAGRRR
jgi:hypothetical protein